MKTDGGIRYDRDSGDATPRPCSAAAPASSLIERGQ